MGMICKFVITVLPAALLLLGSAPAAGAPLPKGIKVVATFNGGVQNEMGGFHNRFQAAPSKATTMMTSQVRRGLSGRSLRISAERDREGYCGAWMHLFDFRDEEPRYFNAKGYRYLSFWVRGEKGGERFQIQFADRRWIEKEDSVRIGSITALLKGRVTTEWQEVLIPLHGIDEVELRELGGITFLFDIPGDHTIYIDDVAFKKDDATVPPAEPDENAKPPAEPKPKSMWIWHTNDLLYPREGDPQQELFDFCKEQNIDTVWLQLLYAFEPRVSLGPPSDQTRLDAQRVRCELTDPHLFREFIRRAHAQGIKVFALDGYPEYCQKEYHHLPLAIVDAIIAFNKDAPPEERFDGIHFDNEPHLLIGWSDWRRRERILEEFLELNAECQRRVREQSDMTFGVDIPFWWQENEPGTERPNGLVTFRGVRKPASYHCIDILDDVGIMNYRDAADGADGLIAHGQDLLIYGDTVNKAKIYMGVETFKYEPMTIWLAVGMPKRQYSRTLDKNGQDQSFLSRIEGFKIHTFDDGDHVHVGIELPPDMPPTRAADAERVMGEVAERYGLPRNAQRTRWITKVRDNALNALEKDVSWGDPEPRPIPAHDGEQEHPGIIVTRYMLSKITFGDDTLKDLQTQTDAAHEFFSEHPSFAGFAVHYYRTYEQLVQRHKEAQRQRQLGPPIPRGVMGD